MDQIAFYLSACGLVFSQISKAMPVLAWVAECEWCKTLREAVSAYFGGVG